MLESMAPPRRKPPKKKVPLEERGRGERVEARRLIHGQHGKSYSVYDPDVHPADLVAFFRERLDQVEDAREVWNRHGDLKYVGRPVRPPLLAAWAAKVGVRRSTVWDWEQKHEEFAAAIDEAKAIQEQVVVELGTIGALDGKFAGFVLKNLLGWTERTEQRTEGSFVLKVDEQDKEAIGE